MSQQELNLGILAHVDAGKTTLTERLLYAAGVIDEIGSVDAGTTQTDSLALERQRGITIKSAVVSFTLGDVHVNLIDTPGHPDFIAEVERVLSVLDGAVLVLSAVEGVQPQTRILFRALQRLRVPALLLVNKIDRAGADEARVLRAISERLTPSLIPMGSTRRLGTRSASFATFGAEDGTFGERLADMLAEHDEGILNEYVEHEAVPYDRLRKGLAGQTKRALVYPVFFGSALTGAGVPELMRVLPEMLPTAPGDSDGAVGARVFKIERSPRGERIAYARMFSGTLRVRDRVRFGRESEGKVTSISAFEHGSAVQRPSIAAGGIAKLAGLREIQIGDAIGELGTEGVERQFPPPTFESVVVPRDGADSARLRKALEELAEQDPLIDVRQDDNRREISVSLYGEVQQEVIQATLADEYGIDVTFRDTTPIYVERPASSGRAIEILNAEGNPFHATIGFLVRPAEEGSGISFELQVDLRTAPLYLYKTFESFGEHMEAYVRGTLHEGLFGWQVTDCTVTMTDCTYSVPDGPPSRRGPLSTAGDFRKLTPLVLMQALDRGGTVVCEPMVRVGLEVPVTSIGPVMTALRRVGASVEAQSLRGDLSVVDAVVSAVRARDLQRGLSRLTAGEGVLESEFVGYQPVSGDPPVRRRRTPNPLNRAEYRMHLAHRATRIAGDGE